MTKTLYINSAGSSLPHQLSALTKETRPYSLEITSIFQEQDWVCFEKFIEEQPPSSFSHISLVVTSSTLKNPSFLNCLKQLNTRLVSSVDLIFSEENGALLSPNYLHELTTHIAPAVFYPLRISKSTEQGTVPIDTNLEDFQHSIIANIRKKSAGEVVFDDFEQRLSTVDPIEKKPPKKIKLKEIIAQTKLEENNIAHYIPLEVQHVEVMEQQTMVEASCEVVEVHQQLELHEMECYRGELLGFEECKAPFYKNKVKASLGGNEEQVEKLYELLGEELFANLPHAIKFITPEAAAELALNLPGWVTLNKENLPNGFLLKQTLQGELVLDFDKYVENEHPNVFQPLASPFVSEDELKPFYTIAFREEDLKAWIQNDVWYKQIISLFPTTPLSNLWIKYGKEGVVSFFEKFEKATAAQPGLSDFLLRHYLAHFPQWEPLYSDEAFFPCLERMSHYDDQKLGCLQRFLCNTGSSRYNLSKTLAAFETFWNELHLLCNDQNVSIDDINKTDWFTPEGGDPIVYMERLLVILKNARSLSDQFKLLSHISLKNYGAYYASRFEGFKGVSADMGFHYNKDQQDLLPCNPNTNLYRVDLNELVDLALEDILYKKTYRFVKKHAKKKAEKAKFSEDFWLINTENELPSLDLELLKAKGLAIPFEDSKFSPPYQLYERESDGRASFLLAKKPKPLPLTKDEFCEACFRFIGQQTVGITLSSFCQEVAKYRSNFSPDFPNILLWRYLLTPLFFISHERFQENESVAELIRYLSYPMEHQDIAFQAFTMLQKLYNKDIKLNAKEVSSLIESFCHQNKKFSEYHEQSFVKMLEYLEKNKFAGFKFLGYRRSTFNDVPFIFTLDAAEFLEEDPLVKASYRDNLLLFAAMINHNKEKCYYKNNKGENAQEVTENLRQIRNYLHHAAARAKPNNLQYAIQLLIDSGKPLSYTSLLKACAEIDALTVFHSEEVKRILTQHGFVLGGKLPTLWVKDRKDIKLQMIALISELEGDTELPRAELVSLSIAALQDRLQKAWERAGVLTSIAASISLKKTLKLLRQSMIETAFEAFEINTPEFFSIITRNILNLPDFKDYSDFEKINRIAAEAQKIANLFQVVLSNPFLVQHREEISALLESVNFSKMDYETLYAVLHFIGNIPGRSHVFFLKTLLTNKQLLGQKERIIELIGYLTRLNKHAVSTQCLEDFTRLYSTSSNVKDFNLLVDQFLRLYGKDGKDPLPSLILSFPAISYNKAYHMLNLSENMEGDHYIIADFFIYVLKLEEAKSDAIFQQLNKVDRPTQQKIIEIIANAHAIMKEGSNKELLDYSKLVSYLIDLNADFLDSLQWFYRKTPLSAECLLNGLEQREKSVDFPHFLMTLEKSPFGERDLESQFSTKEVERVINGTIDLVNHTPYSYLYRKQLMEAFLFVNEIGQTLPVYNGKTAIELSNEEIKAFFLSLKEKKDTALTPFQRRLLALGLVRESVYRTTGEFPDSTQMIALIDGMLHQGDFVSNIDTGQGKSLIDTMKAALLWLDSDRVDITTSSVVDAMRDITKYGPILSRLGIPYSPSPITPYASLEDFKTRGINFSTFPQISLFFKKAKVAKINLDDTNAVVSLVMNESDKAILDDRVIYRYAVADASSISPGQEWIYYAINEFVAQPQFIANQKTSSAEDLALLKAYLHTKGQKLKKSEKIINKFSDNQYLTWIESALIVKYVLKENKHYVIPNELEKRISNGVELHSKVVKVLMADGKVSQDSSFGNGVQQLLYAHLNQAYSTTDFFIEPQNKTIISSNNKNLIDYYRNKKGYIWASSGTVGSGTEIEEQYGKYGFEFSKLSPHQKNQVVYKKAMYAANQEEQFQSLVKSILQGRPDGSTPPNLIFCKDIATATKLFQYFEENNTTGFPLQLYTGLGNEKEYINKAGQSGMITITTSVFGRNTDIPYNKDIGLNVWHTSVDSIRGEGQKSGRTGRRGSKGEVNFVYNKEELGKDVNEIQKEIDEFSAKERNVNEQLYDVLGYLYMEIDNLPDDQFIKDRVSFLKEYWSDFSAECEAQFRTDHWNGTYNTDEFINKTLLAFRQILETQIKFPLPITVESVKDVLQRRYSKPQQYSPRNNVTSKDCLPPLYLAYHCVKYIPEQIEDPEEIKKGIEGKLSQLFNEVTEDNFIEKNKEYLLYLNANPATQEVIVDAHRTFLTSFLQRYSTKLTLLHNWMGFSGKLNNIADNNNYLLMFHSFAKMNSTKEAVITGDLIKQSLLCLLSDYLEASWFISLERRKWATELKEKIQTAETIEAVIDHLSTLHIDTAKSDVMANTKRILKPIHFFGHSRFQTTLSRALKLANALNGTTKINKIPQQLEEISKELEQTQEDKRDKRNISVIKHSLVNAWGIKSREEPVGMCGRKPLKPE